MDGLNLVFGLLGVVGLAVSIVSLCYAIQVNRRALKIGRLEALKDMRRLSTLAKRFESWLHSDRQMKDPFTFAEDEDIAWDHCWYILFSKAEDFFAQQDRKLIQGLRQDMFLIADAVTGENRIPDNPFTGKSLQECQRCFSEGLRAVNRIKPK